MHIMFLHIFFFFLIKYIFLKGFKYFINYMYYYINYNMYTGCLTMFISFYLLNKCTYMNWVKTVRHSANKYALLYSNIMQ